MSEIGDCGECGMPAQLVTCVHDDFNGEDCPGSLGGSPWRPSALDADTTPDALRQVAARSFADGRLAAFADATDLTPVLANRPQPPAVGRAAEPGRASDPRRGRDVSDLERELGRRP